MQGCIVVADDDPVIIDLVKLRPRSMMLSLYMTRPRCRQW